MEITNKAAMEEILRRIAQKKFFGIEPYPWQKEFYAKGKNDIERMLMAGNRTGKTFSAAYEFTCHLTGLYPEWWEGYRVTEPGVFWASSLTNETSRDIVQRELLGPNEALGTGMIPGDRLTSRPTWRQSGISGVIDQISIKSEIGTNILQFKTAEQGYKKFQGTNIQVIWQDEEPDDMRVYTEQLTRIITTKGRLMLTFTPLMGETLLVQHYQKDSKHRSITTASWDDAPHLGEEEKKIFLSAYPVHERESRTAGVPMMGEGAIFPIPDEEIAIDPIPIPKHWRRMCGIDFGVAHPAAASWIAYDPDTDIIYIYDCYKKANEPNPAIHGSIIKKKGEWIPAAWPHDGDKTEGASGTGAQIAKSYAKEGVNMMEMSARYDDDKGGPQPVEPIVQEMYTRMSEGRLKVFRHLSDWFQEKRSMYRKDGKIKAINDDVMKSSMYAVMMLRWSIPEYFVTSSMRPKQHKPMTSHR